MLRADFAIRHYRLALPELTSLIGLPYDRGRSIGDAPNGMPATNSRWSIHSTSVSDDLEDHLAELASRLIGGRFDWLADVERDETGPFAIAEVVITVSTAEDSHLLMPGELLAKFLALCEVNVYVNVRVLESLL